MAQKKATKKRKVVKKAVSRKKVTKKARSARKHPMELNGKTPANKAMLFEVRDELKLGMSALRHTMNVTWLCDRPWVCGLRCGGGCGYDLFGRIFWAYCSGVRSVLLLAFSVRA